MNTYTRHSIMDKEIQTMYKEVKGTKREWVSTPLN